MISLLVLSILQPAAAIAQCTNKPVSCGGTYTDALGPSSSCKLGGFPTLRYVFTATAGQRVSLIASNPAGNSIGMTLLNSAGAYITSDFDEPAQISATLAAAGQYFVEVNFGNPNVSGNITLEVSCTGGTATSCSYSGTVNIGQSVTSQLTSADTPCGDPTTYAKAYRIPVNAGDAFTVDYSASYPVDINIAGPDSSGAYRRSTTTSLTTSYVAPTSGNVTVFVMSNTTSPVTGNFTLTVTPLTLPSCGKVRAVKH